jgi:hypothetical protein
MDTGRRGIFIASVLANPFLPTPISAVAKPAASIVHQAATSVIPCRLPESQAKKGNKNYRKSWPRRESLPGRRPELMTIASPPITGANTKPASSATSNWTVGFYIDWDRIQGFSSLERNLQNLDWVMPQWAHLVNARPGRKSAGE